MEDCRSRLADELARLGPVTALHAGPLIGNWADPGDRALSLDACEFPTSVVTHKLNPYEVSHIGEEDLRTSTPDRESRVLDPRSTLAVAVERATPYAIYFTGRWRNEAPEPPPDGWWRKFAKRWLGGFHEVRVGSLGALVSHARMVEPTRRELLESYGSPFTTGVESFDSLAFAHSGAPDDTRRRLIERDLLGECASALTGNAPFWSGIHFVRGTLRWSTTVTDRTSAQRVVEIARFLPRLAHELYGE